MSVYSCEWCGHKEKEEHGSWSQFPYMFFCSYECHRKQEAQWCEAELREHWFRKVDLPT